MGVMGRVEIHIPLVTWRDGRPRYWPSAAQRALGYVGEDLRHADGRWFDVGECTGWSAARLAEIEGRRRLVAAGETTPKRLAGAARRARQAGLVTVGQVVEAFRASPRMQGNAIVEGRKKRPALSAGTIRFYRLAASCLEKFDGGTVWGAAAGDLSGKALSGILDRIERAHGLAQARNVRSLVSAAWTFGRGRRLVAGNPTAELVERLPQLDPDVRPATVEEYLHMVAVADALGLPDLGDVVACAPWCGQRQNDRLALRESQLTEDGVLWTPSKKARKKERLLIPLSRICRERLAAARLRRAGWKVEGLNDRPVFLWERTRTAWTATWYVKCFRQIRHAAAAGDVPRGRDGRPVKEARLVFGSGPAATVRARLEAAGLQPLAALADLKDKHWRDTCLNWLEVAGGRAYLPGFSGHAYGHKDKVLKHYLAVPPEFAVEGLRLLEAWFDARVAAIDVRRTG